ncbi:metal-dependent hydrolase [Halorussus aquaticus]|uniref:Metal-dependent hydrolase n=1 Tax=Halorussus aquaticus TaxID=2953748 RepID=A0ABD5Q345_9EURY|nr:metal-dependent hydrolase [Halorussus aquaticus]
MYPTGHYGVALLFAVPFVVLLGRKSGTVFTTFVLFVALLPDLDLHIPGVIHHGVTHTFLFGVVGGLVVGVMAVAVFLVYVALTGPPRSSRLTTRRVFVWATTGAFLGVASHVVADVLVLLPGREPVSPFWPVLSRKIHIEALPLGAPLRNLGLMAFGLTAHALVFYYE